MKRNTGGVSKRRPSSQQPSSSCEGGGGTRGPSAESSAMSQMTPPSISASTSSGLSPQPQHPLITLPSSTSAVAAPARIPKIPIGAEVEEQTWYHGMRTRKDVESLLVLDGDFLIRATEAKDDNVEIILSIKCPKGVIHLTLALVDGQWQLAILLKNKKMKRFPTIPALVEFYKANKISQHLMLKRPIHRPNWLIKHEKVQFDMKKDHLGAGNFCDVYKGRFDRGDDQIVDVAIKICHNSGSSSSTRSEEDTKTSRIMMLEEARAMSHFIHNYVLLLYGVACDHPPVLIVLEFCPGGALDKHLQKQKDEIEDGERVCYVMEAARGMRYLHQRNCVHRDLAARNCLISAQGHIKIADFGLSKLMDGTQQGYENLEEESAQIPLRWMAPESLKKPQKFSKASDVWSFGVLIYEIFNNGEKPWPDWPNKKVATHIRKLQMPTLPSRAPSELCHVVESMWVMPPNDRLSFRDICLKVWKILKKCPLPKPSKFAVNRLSGVERDVAVKEKECEEEDDNTDTNEGRNS